MGHKPSPRLRAVPAIGAATAPGTFPDHRQAALALLNGSSRLDRKTGGFLGQLTADPSPLSRRQTDWLASLLDRAGLPPVADRGAT